MDINFLRSEVAQKYVCKADKDYTIHAKGYSGKLSNINMAGAEHLVASKSALIALKEAVPDGDTQAEKTKKKSGTEKATASTE